jgi:hypothetical protein
MKTPTLHHLSINLEALRKHLSELQNPENPETVSSKALSLALSRSRPQPQNQSIQAANLRCTSSRIFYALPNLNDSQLETVNHGLVR